MPAVAAGTKHHRSLQAHLRPTGQAVLAATAALIVVVHHSLADPGFVGCHARTHGHDRAAGLVPGNDWFGAALEARLRVARLVSRSIDVQIAAAHARRLDLDYDVARARSGIGKVTQFKFPIAKKDDALHANLHLEYSR